MYPTHHSSLQASQHLCGENIGLPVDYVVVAVEHHSIVVEVGDQGGKDPSHVPQCQLVIP